MAAPRPAGAVPVIATFNSVTLVANPNGFQIFDLAITINGIFNEGIFGGIATNNVQDATGVVIDYGYTVPRQRVTRLELFNNGGGNLNDADGIGSALVEVFDPSGAVLFSGTLVAGNGGGVFNTVFPSALDNVARVRLSNITNLLAPSAAPFIIWRELRAVQDIAPAVDLVKSQTNIADLDGDGQVSVGDQLTYAVTVRNTGTDGLATVTVSDPRFPALSCGPTTALGNPFTNGTSGLAFGDRVVCTGVLTVTQADVDIGAVTNTAAVTATGSFTGIAVGDTDTVTVATAVPGPALSVAKSASPAAGAEAGDTLTYTIVATNTGNVTLTGVVVSDPALGPLTCTPVTPATFGPGASTVCTGSRSVTQADVDTGGIANASTATGRDPAGVVVTGTTSVVTPTAPRAGLLTVDKATTGHDDGDGSGSVSVGDVLDYEITVTNAGTVTQTGVIVVDDRVPALACTPTQPATLAPGASITCTGSVTVTQAEVDAGAVVNTATATGTPPAGVTNPPAVATVDAPTEPAIPGLSVVKNVVSATDPDDSGSFTPGDVITYQITAANTGNVVLTGVTVTDPLLSDVECTPAVPATLDPAVSITCTGTYVLDADDATAGSRANTGSATGTAPGGGTVDGDGSLTVPVATADPQLTVTKSVVANDDVNASDTVDRGDTLTYEIVLANTGNVLLTGVTLVDSRATLDCAVPESLAPGASVTCTATLVVTQADQDASQVENTATASGQTPAGAPIGAAATSVVATEGVRPDTTFTKVLTSVDDVDGDGEDSVGDLATFELTLTNTGNVTLTDAEITDDLIPVLACAPTAPATLAPGESLVCTGTVTITQADQDSGVLVNHGAGTASHAEDTVTRAAQAVLQPAPAQPALSTTKTAVVGDTDGSGGASVAETVTYTITATNTGNVTLHGVAVIDLQLPGLVCSPSLPAELAPLATVVCTGSHVVTQAEVDLGRIDNVATATGDDPAGTRATGVGVAAVATSRPPATVPPTSASPPAAVATVDSPAAPSNLPGTGSEVTALVGTAVGLVAVGAVVVGAGRRRRCNVLGAFHR